MAKSVVEHEDLAGNVIKLGDCLAFSASTEYSSRLGFGRVIRISPARLAVMEAIYNGSYWSLSEKRTIKPQHCLLIPMRSLPQEVFVMLDNLVLG